MKASQQDAGDVVDVFDGDAAGDAQVEPQRPFVPGRFERAIDWLICRLEPVMPSLAELGLVVTVATLLAVTVHGHRIGDLMQELGEDMNSLQIEMTAAGIAPQM